MFVANNGGDIRKKRFASFPIVNQYEHTVTPSNALLNVTTNSKSTNDLYTYNNSPMSIL